MSFQTDIAGDFAIFDGGLTVSLYQNRGGVDTEAATVRNAVSQPLSVAQLTALGGLGLTGQWRSWSFNAGDVGSTGVVNGDTFNDGTNDWYIESASLKTLSNRWDVVARLQTPQT